MCYDLNSWSKLSLQANCKTVQHFNAPNMAPRYTKGGCTFQKRNTDKSRNQKNTRKKHNTLDAPRTEYTLDRGENTVVNKSLTIWSGKIPYMGKYICRHI